MAGEPRPKQGMPGPKPRRPLPRRSKKRAAEDAARAEVRRDTKIRAGGRCEMEVLVPEVECWGPLDTDERKSRGVNPGGHLDVGNTQLACRAHHDWRTNHPKEAHERGLRVKSWETEPPRPGVVE